jgi:hypothetical protein
MDWQVHKVVSSFAIGMMVRRAFDAHIVIISSAHALAQLRQASAPMSAPTKAVLGI